MDDAEEWLGVISGNKVVGCLMVPGYKSEVTRGTMARKSVGWRSTGTASRGRICSSP